MQSNDTYHSVTAPFPSSVHLFRGCSVTIMSWLWIKCGRELQTLLETRLLLCTIMH